MRENDSHFKTSLACFILFRCAVNHMSSPGLSSLFLLRIYYVFLFSEKMVFSAEQVFYSISHSATKPDVDSNCIAFNLYAVSNKKDASY